MTSLSTVTPWVENDPLSPTCLNSKLQPILNDLVSLNTALVTATVQLLSSGVSQGTVNIIDFPNSSITTANNAATVINNIVIQQSVSTVTVNNTINLGSGLSAIDNGTYVTIVATGSSGLIDVENSGSTVTGSTATINFTSGLSVSIVSGIPTVVNTGAVGSNATPPTPFHFALSVDTSGQVAWEPDIISNLSSLFPEAQVLTFSSGTTGRASCIGIRTPCADPSYFVLGYLSSSVTTGNVSWSLAYSSQSAGVIASSLAETLTTSAACGAGDALSFSTLTITAGKIKAEDRLYIALSRVSDGVPGSLRLISAHVVP